MGIALRNTGKRAVSLAASLALVASMTPVLTAAPAYASDEVAQVDGVYYTLHDDGTASLGRQTRSGKNLAVDVSQTGAVTIPASITYNSRSYAVTEVTKYAFSDGSGAYGASISSLSLPASVTKVGDYAFAGCKQLTSISFGGGSKLGAIGSFAFAQCLALQGISVPVTCESVGSYCFYNCTSLQQVSFEEPQATEPTLKFDTSAFASTSAGTALTSIELPARTYSIPVKMFQNQVNLQQVDILAPSLVSIGSLSFDCCSALREIRIPALTTTGGTPIGTRAFRGCESLKTVYFTADVDYEVDATQFSSSEMLTTYSAIPLDIDNIVYYGSTAAVLFPTAGNHYYRIGFYGSEEAYKAGEEPLSYACVRDDIALGKVRSTMAAKDAKGAVVIEGEIPELSSSGSWYFPGHSQDDTLTTYTAAYMVDDNNLANAEFAGTFSYPYINAPIALDLQLRTAGGTVLEPGKDYTRTVTDASGKAVAEDAIVEPGTYTIQAVTLPGAAYAGRFSTTFEVTNEPVNITRLAGEDTYVSSQALATQAASLRSCSTVIVISGKKPAQSMAVSGLAGAMDAVVVSTNPSRLSVSAKTVLRTLQPEMVIMVGSSKVLSDTVKKQIVTALPESTSVSRLYGSSLYQTATALYTRTKSAGVWYKSYTCVLVSGKAAASAAAVGSYAYATASPVFAVNPKKGLDTTTKKAIKAGKFKKVVLVGTAKQVPNKVKTQLGKKYSYKRLSGSDNNALSAAIAKYAVKTGVLGYDNAVVAGSKDVPLALCAASLAGRSGSVMLFASNGSTGTANVSLVGANKYSVFDLWLAGDTSCVSEQTESALGTAVAK